MKRFGRFLVVVAASPAIAIFLIGAIGVSLAMDLFKESKE